jgi:arginyl-tRNA synthetase
MTPIPAVLTPLVRQALATMDLGDLDTERMLQGDLVGATKGAGHGDYQCNLALRMAKPLRTNPRAFGQKLASALPDHPAVAKVEVAGPGFINLTLSDEWLGEQLAALGSDPHLGVVQRDGAVVIDYSSPNVAKRMHVGHLRSTVIGAALDRMYRHAGYRVTADNHIGDWGTQFGKLIVAWGRWLDSDAFALDPVGELQRIYVHYAKAVEEDPGLADLARAETAKLQSGDPANIALWKRFIQVSLEDFEKLYSRMDIHFDEVLGESAYNHMLGPLVQDLLDAGVAEVSDGAVIFPFTAADGKGLKDSPFLIRKGDGAFLYATTDLATVRHRLDTWAPTKIVYVTDTRQQLHFRQLFAAVKRLGWVSPGQLEHVWFGLLTLPDGAMSTRKGNVINLEDVLNEAVRRARLVVDEKVPEMPEQERADVAEAVGIGAVRYADLSQNPQSNVTFDWNRMLALEGNTAPFLLYSYARARSIQRKGDVTRPVVLSAAPAHPLERELVLALLRFSEAFDASLRSSRPNLLCDYLFNLATRFNRFYYELKVLKVDPKDRERRLSLVEASAQVLSTGLSLLGIRTLERM